MSNWVVIDGLRPWDGRYEFVGDVAELTIREWGWIKRLSGYLPATLDEGLAGVDPEVVAVFAVIALYRAGRVQAAEAADVFGRFVDTPFGGSVRLEFGAETETPDPLSPASSSGNGSSSGSGSTPSSANPAARSSRTGTRAPAISEPDPAISGI